MSYLLQYLKNSLLRSNIYSMIEIYQCATIYDFKCVYFAHDSLEYYSKRLSYSILWTLDLVHSKLFIYEMYIYSERNGTISILGKLTVSIKRLLLKYTKSIFICHSLVIYQLFYNYENTYMYLHV